jgi:hypothetical protein
MFGIKPKLGKSVGFSWPTFMTYWPIRAKVVMFGIKTKLMKCRFELTYLYDLLTYLNTLKSDVLRVKYPNNFNIQQTSCSPSYIIPNVLDTPLCLHYWKVWTHSVPSHHREIAIQILTWNLKPTSHPHLAEYKIRICIVSIHSSTRGLHLNQSWKHKKPFFRLSPSSNTTWQYTSFALIQHNMTIYCNVVTICLLHSHHTGEHMVHGPFHCN